MKAITYEQLLAMKPCWLNDPVITQKIMKIFQRQKYCTALDILNLKEVSTRDKFGIVLREEFLPTHVLHEFECRCGEYAIAKIENPDPRSVNAIAAKRAWIKGDIGDEELKKAMDTARAVERAAKWEAACTAKWTAACPAEKWAAAWAAASAAARDAAEAAACSAECSAECTVAWSAARTAAKKNAWETAWVAGYGELCEKLIALIEEELKKSQSTQR